MFESCLEDGINLFFENDQRELMLPEIPKFLRYGCS